MPQIINQVGRGAMFGQQLGQGLGEGLQALAQHKMNQIAERHKTTNLAKAYEDAGLTPEVSRALSLANPKIQQSYLESIGFDQFGQKNSVAQSLGQSGIATPNEFNASSSQFAQPSQVQNLKQQLAALNPQAQQEEQESLLNKLRSPDQRREALKQQGLQIPEQQNSQNMQRFMPGQQVNNAPEQAAVLPQVTPKQRQPVVSPENTTKTIQRPRVGKPDKEDVEFGQSLSNRIEQAPRILKLLDEIDELVEKPNIQWGLIASKSPLASLNNNTKKLVVKFNKILSQEIQAEGQGRGSDLMRGIIQSGKFSLDQGPEVWRDVSSGMRGTVEYDKNLYKTRHELRKEFGGKPFGNEAYLTRERVEQQAEAAKRNKESQMTYAKGEEIKGLPKSGSQEAKNLEGRVLKGPHGPIIYEDGVPYHAVKKNGQWEKQ